MPSRRAQDQSEAVLLAIESLRAALARIDRTSSTEVVRRREAATILSRLADAPVAFMFANDRVRIVEANAAATELTGYTRTDLLRMSIWDLTPERNRVEGLRMWQAFLELGEQNGSYRIQRRDGTLVTTTYFAVAHVLPGLHLSALATGALVRRLSVGRNPPRRPART